MGVCVFYPQSKSAQASALVCGCLGVSGVACRDPPSACHRCLSCLRVRGRADLHIDFKKQIFRQAVRGSDLMYRRVRPCTSIMSGSRLLVRCPDNLCVGDVSRARACVGMHAELSGHPLRAASPSVGIPCVFHPSPRPLLSSPSLTRQTKWQLLWCLRPHPTAHGEEHVPRAVHDVHCPSKAPHTRTSPAFCVLEASLATAWVQGRACSRERSRG